MLPIVIALVSIWSTHISSAQSIATNNATELQQLASKHPYRVLLFTKPGCIHCKKIEPSLQQVMHDPELNHITFVRIDMSKPGNSKLKNEYNFQTVPHFVIESEAGRITCVTKRDASFIPHFKQEILEHMPSMNSKNNIETDVCITHQQALTYPFQLPKLPYAYTALEPYIDAQTMQLHYEKHHQAYVDNLNAALKDHPKLQKIVLDQLLLQLENLPAEVRIQVRNQGGGHSNHTFFWSILQPHARTTPTPRILAQINQQFGSFAQFQEQFNKAAKSVFGSGWAWLVSDRQGKLTIIVTHNQDSPLSEHQTPILGLDVWEHAYYLKYQNRRPDYISAWWQVINWPQVEHYYAVATAAR